MKFDKLFEKSKQEKKVEDKEERRQKALSSGNSYTYVVCPMCCFNKILSKTGIHAQKKGKVEDRIKFNKFDLENGFFIQIRKSIGGKRSGFWLDDSQSLNLEQAILSGEYDDIVDDIKVQCKKIIKKIDELRK